VAGAATTGGYDSNIIDFSLPLPTTADPLKSNLPAWLIPLLEDIKLQMLNKLNANSSALNIDSFGKSILKGILEDITSE
jgi:hypothetical protein